MACVGLIFSFLQQTTASVCTLLAQRVKKKWLSEKAGAKRFCMHRPFPYLLVVYNGVESEKRRQGQWRDRARSQSVITNT